MRYGFWLPVFGGWLRNVEDEDMEATWPYVSRLARRAEEIGFDLTLVAEARQYGVAFDEHDRRYERSAEWLEVVDRMWSRERASFDGEFFHIEDAVLEPKPLRHPRPTIWAGGESPAGKDFISRSCDGWLTHGDPPRVIGGKVEEMRVRRARLGLDPMAFGAAGYVVVRDSDAEVERELERITDVKASAAGYANYQDWIDNTQLERRVSIQDYSVSNRGLRAGLVGTPDEVAERIAAFEEVGLDLLLLQFSPQLEEMERFAEEVMPRVEARRRGGRMAAHAGTS